LEADLHWGEVAGGRESLEALASEPHHLNQAELLQERVAGGEVAGISEEPCDVVAIADCTAGVGVDGLSGQLDLDDGVRLAEDVDA